jgi:hypothetical protein
MLLSTPLNGNFKITLELENKIKTIGGNNNAIYFYENGTYKKAIIANGTYTEVQLATAATAAMNMVGSLTYTITYIPAITKFSAEATGLFCFGSTLESSYEDSMQDKTMGFFNDHNSLLSDYILADREAILVAPNQIGVKISDCYPMSPVRNNNPFNEVGLLATLDSGVYKIVNTDNQFVRIPKAVGSLTFTFPAVEGGGLHNVNTNNLTARLVKV